MWGFAAISHWPLNGSKKRKILLWVSCGSDRQVVTLKLKRSVYFKEDNERWSSDGPTVNNTQPRRSLSDPLTPAFQHQLQNLVFLASAQISEAESLQLSCYCCFDSPPALPADLIVNKQVTSYLIQWCTKDLFHFSFSGESRGHPVFHASGWNIDSGNPQQPLRPGLLSCPSTFMFGPALMPPVWLRKCCADARWPSDLCLLLMLRKAVFGLVFLSVFGLGFFFFLTLC